MMNNIEAAAVAQALNEVIDNNNQSGIGGYLIGEVMKIAFSDKENKAIKALDLIKLTYLLNVVEKHTRETINEMDNLLKSLADVMNYEDWHLAHAFIANLEDKINKPTNRGIFTVYNGGKP